MYKRQGTSSYVQNEFELGYSIFYPYRGVEGNFEEYFLSKSLNGFRLSPPLEMTFWGRTPPRKLIIFGKGK